MRRRLWKGTGTTFANVTIPNVFGSYEPLVGDFNDDHHSDVLWYAPGSAADSLWRGAANGFTAGPAVSINGNYTPAVGDFNGDGLTDVFWSDQGGKSHTWFGTAGGFRNGAPTTTAPLGNSTFATPTVADFNGDGHDDILWSITDFDLDNPFNISSNLALWRAH